MLLSMLVKLYNQQQQQQLELEHKPQQQQQMAHMSPNSTDIQQQPDEQTLAAMIAAKQLLQLQQFGRQQQDQQQIQQQQQQQQQQMLQLQQQIRLEQQHVQQQLFQRSQQPLHQLNLADNQPQPQQQQQPFDLSLKSSASSNSSINNSTGTAANSPAALSVSQLASQHFQMQLQAAGLAGQHSPLGSSNSGDAHLDDEEDEDDMMDNQLLNERDDDLMVRLKRSALGQHHQTTGQQAHDEDSLDLVKRHSGCSPLASSPLGHQMSCLDDDDMSMLMEKSQAFKPQPFKIIRDKDNNFSCQYCNKKYQSMGALKMHVRTHTLPCQCKICGKAFSRPWLLQGHIRTHTGEKPFKCDQCHRAFADRSNLRAHLQTHAKVKKYSCKCCLKTFSRMSLQTKHEEHCNSNTATANATLNNTQQTFEPNSPSVTASPSSQDINNQTIQTEQP